MKGATGTAVAGSQRRDAMALWSAGRAVTGSNPRIRNETRSAIKCHHLLFHKKCTSLELCFLYSKKKYGNVYAKEDGKKSHLPK